MSIRVPLALEKDICLEYINGMSVKGLSEMFQYSKHIILRVIADNGLPLRKMGGVRAVEEWNYYEIYELVQFGYTITEICEKKDLKPQIVKAVFKAVNDDPLKYEEMKKKADQWRT